MNDIRQIEEYLYKENIIEAIKLVNKLIKEKGVVEVYESVICKVMEEVGLPNSEGKFNIINEHMFSNHIKTILENCVTEVYKQAKAFNGKTVLVCGLEEEFHEIGLRMIVDYFRLAGYKTVYLGCNIPNEDIVKAAIQNECDYIAVSVTNFYHLPKLVKLATLVKNNSKAKLLAGGQALTSNPGLSVNNKQLFKVIDSVDTIFNMEVDNETSI